MTRVAEVVVVGSLHLDLLVEAPDRPRKGETLAGSRWSRKCGGKGHNQALEAARHGARTAMVGAVGDDDFGALLQQSLVSASIDVTHVRIEAAGNSGMSVAILDPSGDYAAVIVSGINLSLGVADVTAAGRSLTDARVVVLQNEIPDAANVAAACAARAAGAIVLMNAAPARTLPVDLAANVDVLIVNEVEAEMLGAGQVGCLSTAAHAAARLLDKAPAAIVTAGAAGLALASRDGTRLALPAHRVPVVSTHGAGDAFVGALAARLVGGEGMAAAARYANAAAAALVATPERERPDLRPVAALRLLQASEMESGHC